MAHWPTIASLALPQLLFVTDLFHQTRGPDFLALYAAWFVVTWGGMHILRRAGMDWPVTTLVALASFEAVGVARLYYGSQAGLADFQILIIMMVAGFFLFVIRAKNFETGSKPRRRKSSSGWSGCSTGGGCGSSEASGSGCGGGGCGGCGGD